MKNRKIGFFACVLAIWICTLWYSVLRTDSKDLVWIYNWFIDVVASIDDEIRENSVRCGSFQVAWNDFIEEMWLESQDFWWLSKNTFKSNHVSETSYYNNFWLFTLDLKSEIERWVSDKFKEGVNPKFISDWSIIPQSADYYEWKKEKKYAVYSKFKKSINLKHIFEDLWWWRFADVYDGVEFFGIDCNTSKTYDKVRILYYYSDSDFAISIRTWWGDEIILSRWTKWKTFMITYNTILSKERNYGGSHEIYRFDCLKIPEFKIKLDKEIYRLRDKKILQNEGEISRIGAALQDIEIKIDNPSSIFNSSKADKQRKFSNATYHYFNFDYPFMVFIKESDKSLPYFAAYISDIKLFQ